MSLRRQARGVARAPGGGIPDPLLSRLHPIWADVAAVRKMSAWAVRNDYESEAYPRHPDWHRLRAAGVGGPPDRPGDRCEEARLRRVAWTEDRAARWRP